MYYRTHVSKRPLCKTRHDLGNTQDLQKIMERNHSSQILRSTVSPREAAGLTFLTQEVFAGAINPEQSEQTREVENAFPAVPIQEERSCTTDYQGSARESTRID